MPVSDGELEATTAVSPKSRLVRNSQLQRSRKFLLLAVVLVVVVITVSTIAQSNLSESVVIAQHNYEHAVTPVEEADVVFNGGASTPPDHSRASTRALIVALGIEFTELHTEKWPKVAEANIALLETFTASQKRLLQELRSATKTGRSAILHKHTLLLKSIESTDISILKELKLPTPISVSRPVAPPKTVP